ncbi:argH [Gossypium australe]|uniref:ArgH n=1 Tax=Gossypium australe TaxID=47621 RepID=A0A5B6VHQ1_9ROSI|nr:argH [Gossypium australe]
MERKHLSSIANHVLRTTAQELGTSVEHLVEESEAGWNPEVGDYSRKLMEFCSSKALINLCQNIEERLNNGSYSRFTYDMMLAWENPSGALLEKPQAENEDSKISVNLPTEQDDIPLFYSDLMPLLVNDEPSVGEDAFVWLGSLVPLVADIVNGRFTFETLTAPTGNRLFFPAYDKFLKEIDNCMKHLQKQATPKGVELADDEYILHVEGTATTQRVVRHIEGTSWPGRLTLTNHALYFDASGVFTYDDALKIDLSRDIEHGVKPAATGPWGAPLFDKAMIYESPEFQEGVLLEFPEMTSSTRRDHWLALTKEVLLMHKFLSKFKAESPIQAWEMHARSILSIIRLHAAREMLRICPPDPTKFLIFSLYDELPKGDYVLEQLAESLNKVNIAQPCSAHSILRKMNFSEPTISEIEEKRVNEKKETIAGSEDDDKASLETAINQTRKEEREVVNAKEAIEGLKDEGISENALILMELLKPLKSGFVWFRETLSWERPRTTLVVIAIVTVIAYKEWVGKAISAGLLVLVAKMIQARQEKLKDKQKEITVCTAFEPTASTRENIVSAQYMYMTICQIIHQANVTILKLHSVLVSRAPKHANVMMVGITGLAILLAVTPLKYLIISAVFHWMIMRSKLGKYMKNNQNERRVKEWWDSIPPTPVRIVDQCL